MKLFKYGMSLAAVALLASCANDNVIDPGTNPTPGVASGDGMFITLNVSQQVGTRTATGSETEEAGQTFENAVNNATIFLVDPNANDKIVYVLPISTSAGWTIAKQTGSGSTVDYKMTGAVNREEMLALASAGEGTKYDLFVVCNVPASLTLPAKDALLSGDGANVPAITITDLNSLLTDYANTSTSSFLMSNADATQDGKERTQSNAFITENITLSGSNQKYTQPTGEVDENGPFQLGTIKVQRAVARFDYAKGATSFPATSNVSGVNINLKGIALVNVNRKFNLFKQVGVEATNWKYFQTEHYTGTEARYVFNPNYSDMDTHLLGANKEGNKPSDYLDKALFNDSHVQKELSSLSYDDITKLNGTYEGTEVSNQGYDFWTYCSPNTMHAAANQKNGITTGVVFRALISPVEESEDTYGEGDGKTPHSAFWNAVNGSTHAKVYAFNDVIYGTYSDLLAAAAKVTDANSGMVSALMNVLRENSLTLETATEAETNIHDDLVSANFSIYTWEEEGEDATASPAGYYCYYIYWNEHNEGKLATMEPMEFGVVRNNIYKLKVSSIKSLGHPSIPGDDPDPTDPDDPDQEPKMYMSVEVQVVPWSVRVNNIEF